MSFKLRSALSRLHSAHSTSRSFHSHRLYPSRFSDHVRWVVFLGFFTRR